MTKEGLFGLYSSTLNIINNPTFSDQHRQRAAHLNQRISDKLLWESSPEEISKMHELIFDSHRVAFGPKIAESLRVKSTVGTIDKGDEKIPVERQLIGRVCGGIVDNAVVCLEYFEPVEEKDPDLFNLAKKHHGLSGIEGVVKKMVPMSQAITLVFTGAL